MIRYSEFIKSLRLLFFASTMDDKTKVKRIAIHEENYKLHCGAEHFGAWLEQGLCFVAEEMIQPWQTEKPDLQYISDPNAKKRVDLHHSFYRQ